MISKSTVLNGQAIELRLVSCSKARFHELLKKHSGICNAGATTSYDEKSNLTNWIVVNDVFGQSVGRVGASTEYAVNALVIQEVA